LIASLYVAVTYLLSPISYMILNIRVSDILRGLIPIYGYPIIVGIAIGQFIVNIFSPLGFLDLLSVIPATIGGIIILLLAKRGYALLGFLIHWIILSTWLVFLLHTVLNIPYILLLSIYPQVFISDFILPYILYREWRARFK